jgi:polysaccharide pyruvyl transferase WcaK-like protein
VLRNLSSWVKAAGIPVALVGVSVERLSDELRADLRAFLDLCSFAWFRDRGSLEQVGDHPKAFVAPDLTWLYPQAALPPASSACVAVSLRKHAGLDVDAWKLTLGRVNCPTVPWPLYFEQQGDAEPLRRVFPDRVVADEFTMAPLEDATSVVSMRYHGVLFGLQAARPVIGVGAQPKLVRFMSEQGLSAWRLDEADVALVPELLDRLDAQRERVMDQVLALRQTQFDAAARAAESTRDRLLSEADIASRHRPRWSRKVRAFLDTAHLV